MSNVKTVVSAQSLKVSLFALAANNGSLRSTNLDKTLKKFGRNVNYYKFLK